MYICISQLYYLKWPSGCNCDCLKEIGKNDTINERSNHTRKVALGGVNLERFAAQFYAKHVPPFGLGHRL